MKLTAKLKAHMLAKGWINKDTSDDDVRKLVSEKLLSGELTAVELADLTKEAPTKGQEAIEEIVSKQVQAALAPVIDQIGKLAKGLESSKEQQEREEKERKDREEKERKEREQKGAGDNNGNNDGNNGGTSEQVEKAVKEALVKLGVGGPAQEVTPQGTIARAASSIDVRVKSPLEQFDNTKKTAVIPERSMKGVPRSDAGQPATFMGRTLDMPTERDKAIAGAYFKWAIGMNSERALIPDSLRMTELDEAIVQTQLREGKWTGVIKATADLEGGVKVDRRKLTDMEIKALLDDNTSGGLEIAPIEFDDALILTPVLFGELFPKVTVTTLARGRRVEGASIGNPSWTSGTAEGNAITPITTTGFVTAFDTTIFPAVGAMEIGEDFLEDSPTNIGAIIMQKFGEKHQEWLDEQIAVGDGTTEPQGIFNAAGTIAVNSDNGTGGDATVSDYEALMFAVTKAFRNSKGGKNCFIGNDTTYRRARGIPVSGTDARRVFGMTHMDYRLFDHDFCIQNSLTNSQCAYVNLAYYRMYRRLGMTARVERNGNYLALRNQRLLVVRMRWGGGLELGGAAAVSSDWKS